MRTFIIGSKQLSIEVLNALIDHGHEVLGAYTRDDEPSMKIWHHELGHGSLKAECEKLGISVYESVNVNSNESKTILRNLEPDVIFSCFWGQIITQDVLDIPRLGIYNLHTAYLPANRGSRPIPWALIRNDGFTGLTIHQMYAGVDNGPILDQVKVEISDLDTAESLYEKVTDAGATLFIKTLGNFEELVTRLTPQSENKCTYHPRGEPFGGQINHHWDNDKIDRFKRAFTFPPFRAYRMAPKAIGKQPKGYAVFQRDIPILRLSKPHEKYVINSIGDKNLRVEIRREIIDKMKPGTMVNVELDGMFPVHDILVMNQVGFVVSKIKPIDDWLSNPIGMQPFRYENGLLEIPSVRLNNMVNISLVANKATELAANVGCDIFIGIVVNSDAIFNSIQQETKKAGLGQLTFSEVYQIFDTEYENINT